MSTLDLLGDGLTLFTGAPGPAWAAALESDIPVVVRSVDPATAQALDTGPEGAVLVRPDGRPVARWSTTPHEKIRLTGGDVPYPATFHQRNGSSLGGWYCRLGHVATS